MPVNAQELSGTFSYDEAASDDIEQAVREATSGMNFITRPIARSRLRSTTLPVQRLEVDASEARVSVAADEREPIVTTPDGTPTTWTGLDDEELQVSTEWRDGRLHELFRADDGQRENVYESTGGDALRVHVTVSSDRLPEPVRYTLVYRQP